MAAPDGARDYYATLGVGRDAGSDDIRRAYRALAMKHHPDKGGDAAVFKEVSHAYEVLSDPEKRKLYDQFGEEGLRAGGGGGGGGFPAGMDPFEMFGSVFGRGGGGERRRTRTPDARYNLTILLEDMYNGCTRKMQIARNRVCVACGGTGSATRACTTCADCGGAGMRVHHRQLGPILQRVQTACARCGGGGWHVAEGDRCIPCEGRRVVKQKEVLVLEVPPGAREGHQVTFRGMADEDPGLETGDLTFVMRQREPHEVFERHGNDLVMAKDTLLRDALCGFDFGVRHLDGRFLRIRAEGVIRPGDILRVPNEGMPLQGNPVIRGDLYVRCVIVFPDSIDARTEMALAAYFPGEQPPPEGDEECTAFRVSKDELNRKGHVAGSGGAGGAGGGGGVECVQQ